MNKDRIHTKLEGGFDQAARRYDLEMAENPAMRWMRQISLQTLESVFHPGQRVLEIGCGTGEEAIHLGRRGVQILATDLSSEMVAVAEEKVGAAGLQRRVQVRQLAASALDVLVDEFNSAAFDGSYASFGPLNGEPHLDTVAIALAKLIKPGGLFVTSVMNRFCLFETIWYLLRGRPRQALRRWRGWARVGVSPELPLQVPTWYFSPRTFARSFALHFHQVSCRALPLLLPPPYLPYLWKQHGRLVLWLERWEKKLAFHWPWRGLGDHFLMVLVRKH
jgi:ubiquinone/menaquinone biosynthesis C-methylase UbiE